MARCRGRITLDVKIDQDKKIIEKTVSGQLTTEGSMMVIYEIATIVNIYPDYSILIDIRDTDPITDMSDMMSLASEISKHGSGFRNKIAFVVPDTEDRARTIELWKTCMETQGFRYRRFFDRESAFEWLAE